MLLTNHTLTGLALGTVVQNPFILAPLAFASHLAVDSLTHFGHDKIEFGKRGFIILATIDNLVALAVMGTALVLQPEHWVQILVGVGFACLPDLLYIPELITGHVLFKPFRAFHSRIQTAIPIGAVTEAIWAALMITVITKLGA